MPPQTSALRSPLLPILASAIVAQLLARHPEHASGHADVVADLELILLQPSACCRRCPKPESLLDTLGTPPMAKPVVAFNEDVLEVQPIIQLLVWAESPAFTMSMPITLLS